MNNANGEASKIWDAEADIYDERANRNRYVQFVSEFISRHAHELNDLPECHVLDLGCGTGLNVQLLSGHRPRIRAEGVDGSARMLERAGAIGKYDRIYTHDLNQKLPPDIESEKFDLVIAFGFLEFLSDIYVCLSECRRVLKVNGTLWATFQRYEAEDPASPPRRFSLEDMTITGHSAGELLHVLSALRMHIIGLETAAGYITQNGFINSYYVLRARKLDFESASRPGYFDWNLPTIR